MISGQWSVLIALAFGNPPPPYPLFEAPAKKFEPSAAAYDRASKCVLVLNDKDSNLYVYREEGGKLVAAGPKHPSISIDGKIMKFEAMAPVPGSEGEYLAVCAYDREDPAYRRCCRFRWSGGETVAATPVELKFEDLQAVVKQATGKPWLKIEGAAFDKAGSKILLGLRNVGDDIDTYRDVVIILRCPFEGTKIGKPAAVFHFSTKAVLGEDQGLADFVRDPSTGDYWLLTTREVGHAKPEDHAGRLFRVPADWVEGDYCGEPRPLDRPTAEFGGKCEALTVMPDGRKLVIFDSDDHGWKKLYEGFTSNKAMFQFLP